MAQCTAPVNGHRSADAKGLNLPCIVDEEEVIVLIMAIVVTAIIVEVIQVLLKTDRFLQVLVIKLERNGHLLVLLFCILQQKLKLLLHCVMKLKKSYS